MAEPRESVFADEESLARLLRVDDSWLYSWYPDDDSLRLSHPWEEVFGALPAAETVTGTDLQRRVSADDAPGRALAIAALKAEGTPLDLRYKLRCLDGAIEWVEEHAVSARPVEGGARRVLGRLRVVSAAQAREARLARAARYDALTALYNRARLMELMDERLDACRREGQHCGFLLVNVDNVGMLNEAHGFAIVDEVLKGVARCIERQLDDEALLGRVGGNQFAVVLPGVQSSDLSGTAETIRSAVRAQVFRSSIGALSVTVSLGGVLAPGQAGDVAQMFGHAEEALSRAKMSGRDCFVEYRRSARQASDRRRTLHLGDRVLAALKGETLRLALQPVVGAGDGEVAFHEALLRLEAPGGDFLPAAAFMNVVEQLGLERLVDRHALTLAIDALETTPDLHLAMNVSGGTTGDGVAFAQLLSALRAHAWVADRLIIEITETVAMRDTHEIAWFVAAFHELGCRIALDDFGAGYSSFRHLKTLPVDLVKIDGQFVHDAANVPENRLFIRALTDLARGLGVATVAEGVECEADAALLATQEIDFLQGYHFGVPKLAPPRVAIVTVA